jgi:hypothetical protein
MTPAPILTLRVTSEHANLTNTWLVNTMEENEGLRDQRKEDSGSESESNYSDSKDLSLTLAPVSGCAIPGYM